MSDDHIKSEISLYLAGSLTESRNRQIEAHAASCEKCRNALSKARSKQSRVKREALKKASPDPLPNLFLARQGEEAGASQPPAKIPWMLMGIVLAAGVGYKVLRHSSLLMHSAASAPVDSDPSLVQMSSAAVPSPAAVSVPSPAPVVPVPEKTPEPPKPPTVVQVQQEWGGPDSGVKESRVVVVRNKEAWDKLRSEMQASLPEVDFEKHVVIGVFAGERTAGSSVSLGKIRETEEEARAPYEIHVAAVQVSTTTVSAPIHPYVLSLLPRLEKKIRLTQKEANP